MSDTLLMLYFEGLISLRCLERNRWLNQCFPMKRMEMHTVACFFPFRKFIDFESQEERYSVCFIDSSYNNCLCFVLCYSSTVKSTDAPNNNTHAFIFINFQVQMKMDFRMKEGTLNRFTPPLLTRLHLLSQWVALTDNVYNQPI